MTTPQGRAAVMSRLLSAPDNDALRRVWESLSVEYQNDPETRAIKDRLKTQAEEPNA